MARLQAHPQLGPRPAARGFTLSDLGTREYDSVYRMQREWVAAAKSSPDGTDRLVFVEHPEVYTLGRRSSSLDTDMAFPSVSVERGGQVTYHNPGQLVSYPILRLTGAERDLHAYLRNLEEVLIRVLEDFGLVGERRPGATGVWIAGREKKIASIGVAVSSWVTYHGTALNVCNDLSGFARIRPCGFPSEVMTSMAVELRGKSCPSLGMVKEAYLRHFGLVFGRQLAV